MGRTLTKVLAYLFLAPAAAAVVCGGWTFLAKREMRELKNQRNLLVTRIIDDTEMSSGTYIGRLQLSLQGKAPSPELVGGLAFKSDRALLRTIWGRIRELDRWLRLSSLAIKALVIVSVIALLPYIAVHARYRDRFSEVLHELKRPLAVMGAAIIVGAAGFLGPGVGSAHLVGKMTPTIIQSGEDTVLKEAGELIRTPLQIKRSEPPPTTSVCEALLKSRRKLIKPDQYFRFYERDWTLKANAGKAAAGEIGIQGHYVTGLDDFLMGQLIGARLVVDAYRTDCGLGGEVLVSLGERTGRLSLAVQIMVARYQKGLDAAASVRKAQTDVEKEKANKGLESSRDDIERGTMILLGASSDR